MFGVVVFTGIQVSCHVVIDSDGTRYVLAPPEAITWHAGRSMWKGREDCNRFIVGIEFQGNTSKEPLTEDQICSAIDYIPPIMKEYVLTESDIVTHKMIRDEYMRNHPRSDTPGKPDINDAEYRRLLYVLHSGSQKGDRRLTAMM